MSGAAPYVVTVVVASRNRRAMLRRCLEALARQTQDPGSFEVMVVDDGSSDGTAAMLAQLQTSFRLRSLQLERAGKPVALNAALNVAEGRVCLFLDDDVIPSPRLVAEHVAAHESDPLTLGIGKLVQRLPPAHDIYARAAARRWNERYAELSEPDWTDCYGGNFSAPLDRLTAIGGFDEGLAAVEDLDVGFRLSRAGCRPRYLPRAEALHADNKPGVRMLAHEQRFGAWCARYVEAHPETRRRLVGWFDQGSVRELVARRLLLAWRVPAQALPRLGHLVPGRGARRIWLDFVARYAFWRGVAGAMSRESWRQTAHGVPVLMYHAFTRGDEEDRYVLPRRSFAKQMTLLHLLRYRVISFAELARTLREGRPLPRRAAVITIDDGYEDNFQIAYPILRRHRFTATLFLVSKRLGGRSDWSEKGGVTDDRPLLSAAQVREMQAGGLDVGAHTRSHRPLPRLPDEEVQEEVMGSRTDLEATLGTSVDTFAYPYGEHDPRAVDAASRASFLGACTTFPGHCRHGEDPLLIPRIEVRGSDGTLQFLRKLCLGGG